MNRRYYLLCLFLLVFLLTPTLSKAITVGPVRLEYSVQPGDTINGELFVQNEGTQTQDFYPSFQSFTENNGQKNFLDAVDDLANWVQIQKSVTLKANESQTIPFVINIPQNAPPGGHYAVIWWSTTPPENPNGQVSVVTRAGVLLYLNVAGNAVENALIHIFSSQQGFFIFSPFINVKLDFANTGNTYEKPSGTIELQNIFGQSVAQSKINPYESIVLPKNDYQMGAMLQPEGFVLGPYKVVLNLTYGYDHRIISKDFWVVMIPWQNGLIFIIIMFLIFFGIPQSIKKYNKWIIKKGKKNIEDEIIPIKITIKKELPQEKNKKREALEKRTEKK